MPFFAWLMFRLTSHWKQFRISGSSRIGNDLPVQAHPALDNSLRCLAGNIVIYSRIEPKIDQYVNSLNLGSVPAVLKRDTTNHKENSMPLRSLGSMLAAFAATFGLVATASAGSITFQGLQYTSLGSATLQVGAGTLV